MKKEQRALDYKSRWRRKTKATPVPQESKSEEAEEPPTGGSGSASSSAQAPRKEEWPYRSFTTGLNKKVQFHERHAHSICELCQNETSYSCPMCRQTI